MSVKINFVVVCVAIMLVGSAYTACSCNGFRISGQGECRTKYRGKEFCYVNPGQCSDQTETSSSNRFWSYKACQKMDQQQCYSISGEKCQFPFSYKGRTFSSCTTFDSENGAAWCTTSAGSYEDCALPCDSSSPSTSCPRNPVIKGLSRNCCTQENPCNEGEGDCDTDNHDTCTLGLKCGDSNCQDFSKANYARADCCYKPMTQEQYYNVNDNGSIDCQTRADCPPNFESVSYECGGLDEPNVCIEIQDSGIICRGSGKQVRDCTLCGTEDCFFPETSNGQRLTWSSSIGGTGISTTIPNRINECPRRTCIRGNKCCRLVSIGYNQMYLGCPSYC